MASVFTKIIRGELPCYRVMEDEHTIAILARDSIRLGHTLVIPKQEVDYWVDLPEPWYSAVHRNAQRVARAIGDATGCVRVGSAVVGFEVPHFHLHLLPLWDMGDLDFRRAKVHPAADMEAIRDRIVEALGED